MAERARVKPRGYFAAQSPEIPFGFQCPRDFELMAHALLEAEAADADWYDVVQIMPDGADAGMDLRLYRDGGLAGVVQCKRYKSAIGPGQILNEAVKMALFATASGTVLPAGCRYQFWTAANPTRVALDLLASSSNWLTENLQGHQWESLITGAQGQSKTLAKLDLKAGDKQAVIEAVKGLEMSHVGPASLTLRLQNKPAVRAMFFQSPQGTPVTADIERQRQERRKTSLSRGVLQGRAGTAPFVAPEALEDTFDAFMSDPAAAFVVLGGSGFGKSTWALRRLETPPQGFEADLIFGEEIGFEDADFVATLSRLLVAGRDALENPSLATRSAWRWLEGANRLLIVDGLDRTTSAARARLGVWLQNSIRLSEDHAVKLVLTTRPETWEPLVATFEPDLQGAIYRPDETGRPTPGISHRLGPLSLQDAKRVYSAYGLPSDLHGRRPFRSPGLIRTYAGLRDEIGRDEVTRRDLMERTVKRAQGEVVTAGLGRASAETFLQGLGRLLVRSSDGRVTLDEAAKVAGNSLPAIDAFLLTDLIVTVEGALRVEPDEAAEYLAAQTLDIDAAVSAVADRGDEPLFVGALAMAVAGLEATDPGRTMNIVQSLMANPSGGPHWEAGVRVIGELRDQEVYEPIIRKALRETPQRGFLLIASNLADLIQDLRLPPERRIGILLELEDGEDQDDWRTKYWTDPESSGRFITPFARAITAVVRNDPMAALNAMIARHDAEDGVWHVTRGLMIEAGQAVPEVAFELLWEQRQGQLGEVVRTLAYLNPIAAARHAETLAELDGENAAACGFLWSCFERAKTLPDPEVGSAYAQAARALLTRALDRVHIARMKLIMAHDEPLDGAGQADMITHWLDVEDHEVWSLIAACPLHLDSLLDRLISEAGRHGGHTNSLDYFGVAWSDLVLHRDASDLTDEIAQKLENATPGSADERLRLMATATELLLYVDEHNPRRSPALQRLAENFAHSPDGSLRKLILYFAGSPVRSLKTSCEMIEYRDHLLKVLVNAEDGSILSTLVWKLTESAQERGQAIERLLVLCRRLGPDAVIAELDTARPLEKLYGQDFLRELQAAMRPG